MNLGKITFHYGVEQGSPEWHELRAAHYTASEAPAVAGVSPHLSREALLRLKATGGEQEIWSKIADRGHSAEAAARPAYESMLGEELYPVTATRVVEGLPLLASLDGITADGETVWEHKLWNDELAAAVEADVVPPSHRPQLDQQLLVTGARRVLFVVSDGESRAVHCWYEPSAEHAEAAALVAAWKQFDEDLREYEHAPAAPAAVAAPVMALPTLVLSISGSVLSSNVAQWHREAVAFVEGINQSPETDEEFAEAERVAKVLAEGERAVLDTKDRATKQNADIDEVFRQLDYLRDLMRSTRLSLERQVKAKKEEIRAGIVDEALAQVASHIDGINRAADPRLPAWGVPAAARQAIAGAMKGRKTLASLRDAAAGAVAEMKIELSAQADRAAANVRVFDEACPSEEARALFPDFGVLAVSKSCDDFAAMVRSRLAEAAERQRQREEAERDLAARRADAEVGREAASFGRAAAPPPEAACRGYDPQGAPDQKVIDRLAPWSARAEGDQVVLALCDGVPVVCGIEEAAMLRDALTAALRLARKASA